MAVTASAGEQIAYALVNFKPLTGHCEPMDTVIIAGDRILAAGLAANIAMPDNLERIDLQGLTLSPGFIDLQLNGCGGVLFNSDIAIDTLDTMHAINLHSGCTAFLPTLITCSDDDMQQAVAVVRQYRTMYPQRVPGIHLEGPYLNPERKGIHDVDFIRRPTPEMIDYLCANADAITMVTLAPEVCPEGTIERLSSAGIVVSLGHTNATCAQAKAAETAGASFATHLHNAMSPLGSREPGVVGAIFDSHRLGAGIIADGHHLSWENLRIAHRLMADRLVLVTDATTPAGTDMETFAFAGQTIYHRDGMCSNVDGTLAGSALTMIDALANSIRAGIDPRAAVRMASINAAKAIHVHQQMGSIAAGHFANLAIFDDSFTVRGSVSGGELKLHR